MAEGKYNMKNPAVKRILQEVKEMQANPSDDFMSLPLEENIFEWQFAIKGPRDTEFEGGIYHGRIQLPADYPFQPPAFMLLSPNGRFETQTKICLSISSHHPEHWQPSWSVRTALVALIAFMPTNPDGALGSLDFKKEQRCELAIKSREAAPKYGTPERQKIIDEIHEYMLSKVLPAPPQHSPQQSASEEDLSSKDGEAQSSPPNGDVIREDHPIAEADARIVEDAREVHVNANADPLRVSFNAGLTVTRRVPATDSSTGTAVTVPTPASDRLFTLAAVGLAVAIAFLLLKKFLKSSGHDIGSM